MERAPHVSDGQRVTRGKGWHWVLREPFAAYFPASEFGDYSAFVRARGDVLKSEDRTRVILLRRPGEQGEETRSFVLKLYLYPPLPRLRTWVRRSKAEQEYNALRQLLSLLATGVEPVAFGVERGLSGMVRSCFVVTGFVEDAIDLRKWERELDDQSPGANGVSETVFRQLGRVFRRLHEARFFLFTPKAANILMQGNHPESPELLFVDLPYARSLRWRPLARWAQSRDLGNFLGSFFHDAHDRNHEPFFEAYLPDPLGRSPAALRRRVDRALRVHRNRTPISALIHRCKRRARRAFRGRRNG